MNILQSNFSLKQANATFTFVLWVLLAGLILGIPFGFWGLNAGLFPATFILEDATQTPMQWGMISLCAGLLVAFKYGLYTSVFLFIGRMVNRENRAMPYFIGMAALLFYLVPFWYTVITRIAAQHWLTSAILTSIMIVCALVAINRYVVMLYPAAIQETASETQQQLSTANA